MRENVFISYRGANYELGQWPLGYGIWGAGASQPEPLEGWPATPEGWSAAWYRFTALETPGTIQPVSPPVAQPASPPVTSPETSATMFFARAEAQAAYGPAAAGTSAHDEVTFGRPAAGPIPYGQPAYGQPPLGGRPAGTQIIISTARARLAAAVLALGVVIGIAGLFPAYLDGSSLASQPFSYVPHLFYFAAWVLSAALIFRGGTLLRTGALLGLGTSAVTFGLFFADAGTAMAGGSHVAGAGLWLSIIGWAACAAGSALAFGSWPADWPRRVRRREVAVTATLILAGLGTAIAFAPPWDRFTLSAAAGGSQTFTAGNAFANPGPVIVGNVAVMLAVFAVAIIAALWRPGRLGWALAAGAAVPMVAQAIAAVVQVTGAQSPAQFGYSPSAAAQAGLKISASLTGAYWAFLAFLLVLLIGCVWLALTGDRGQTAEAVPASAAVGTPSGYPMPGAAPVPHAGLPAGPEPGAWVAPGAGGGPADPPPAGQAGV